MLVPTRVGEIGPQCGYLKEIEPKKYAHAWDMSKASATCSAEGDYFRHQTRKVQWVRPLRCKQLPL
jgi:hypothetical protein